MVIKLYNMFKIHRLKARARHLHNYRAELLNNYSCGHSLGMQIPSYKQVHDEYHAVLTKLKLIDPNYPKD